jgi:hypothetical protein
VRLSDSERKRIARAAEARDLAFSSFVRWAALERAADELERAKPKPRPKPPVLEEEAFRRHSFVEGECERCGLDLDDVRGRDRSCTPHGREMVMV